MAVILDTIICCCGEDLDCAKRVTNSIKMITTGKFSCEISQGSFFITTKEQFTHEQLQMLRKTAETAVQCDGLFPNKRKFALYGPEGNLLDRLTADNDLDAVHEAFFSLETGCDVTEITGDEKESEDEL